MSDARTPHERLAVMRDLYRELTELQSFPLAQRRIQEEIERLREMWKREDRG